MIKFLAIFLFVVSGHVFADPITMTHMAGKASVLETEMQMLGKNLTAQSMEINYVATGQCVDAAKEWNNTGTKPIIMPYSTNWARYESMTGKPCTANLEGARIASVRTTQQWLCSGTKSKPFNTPGLKVGYQTVQPGVEMLADINKLNGWSWKGIPTSSTGDSLIALANGDIDYYFIIRSGIGDRIEKGQLKCYASSDRGDTLPYMGDVFRTSGDLHKTLTVLHIMLTKNLTEDQFQKTKTALDPAVNPEWKKYLEFNNIWVEKLSTDNQYTVTKFNEYAKQAVQYYKK